MNESDPSSDENSGFIGKHMAKMREKQKKEDDAKLAKEQEIALAHDSENMFSQSIQNKAKGKKKNKKRGILARAEEKMDKEMKKEEDNDALLDEALDDPSYQEEIKEMTIKNKKKVKAAHVEKRSDQEIVAEALLGA